VTALASPGPLRRPVAVVTGASRGLGAVISQFLAARGFTLLLNGRDARSLAAHVHRLSPFPAEIHAVPGDISDPTVRARLQAEAAALGGVDLLVNNASELGPSPLPSLAEIPLGELERIYAINVAAPLGLIQSLLPLLAARRGLVVNISSDAAVGGYPGWGGYGASKAALDLLSLTLAHELSEQGVSVASVDPGDMRTQMHQDAYPGQDISDRPLPEITLPFWAWLLGQPPTAVTGHRFRAQSDQWEVPA
jgi:NAD(P)-dependent dehydrogenase (short-subunit alcohol dehydrogenase family)